MTTVREKAIDDFSLAAPEEMAAWSGACLLASPMRLKFSFCGHTCEVLHPQAEMQWSAAEELHEEEEVLILQYLAQATGLPFRERWLSFLELPGGPHHDVPFRKEAHLPLAQGFAKHPQKLYAAARDWGGTAVKGYGDAACIIPAFPRLPLLVVVWGQNEEFPARATLLFDASAPGYLSTASLYVMGIAVTRRIVQSGSFLSID